MQRTILGAVIIFVLLFTTVFAGQSTKPMTNQDIKDLLASGLSNDAIIDKIHAAQATNFDTSLEGVRTLRGDDVPDAVIRVMIGAHRAAAGDSSAMKRMEPESTGDVYLLAPTGQSLKPLPKVTANVVSGKKAVDGGPGSVQIPDPASSFRLKSGNDLEFIVKCTNPESFDLYQFVKNGHNRESVVAPANAKSLAGAGTPRVGSIPFIVTKYSESSYRFLIMAPEPGEYGFLTGRNVFHFAVDPK